MCVCVCVCVRLQVYVSVEAGVCADEAARVCVRARLAPSAPARTAELALCEGALRVRLAVSLPPRGELLLWFSAETLATLDMPFLTPRHVRARGDYQCAACAHIFDEPNPLKVHLFLRCAPPEPAPFWREVAARLRAVSSPPALVAPAAHLEALAAAWGRSRAGHVCVYCGKLHARRYGLKIHLRTHTGYRPLRCRHCARPFGDPSNLNKHERLHARRGEGSQGEGEAIKRASVT